MTKKIVMYPATFTVHWPTGPVPCCEKHAQALAGLGRMLGSHIAVTKNVEKLQCTNCVNEARV